MNHKMAYFKNIKLNLKIENIQQKLPSKDKSRSPCWLATIRP